MTVHVRRLGTLWHRAAPARFTLEILAKLSPELARRRWLTIHCTAVSLQRRHPFLHVRRSRPSKDRCRRCYP